MKTLIFLVYLLPFVFSLSLEESFDNWIIQNNKNYETEDYKQYRFGIYKANMEYIENHNRQNRGFTLAMNQFGDLTSEEYARIYLRSRMNATVQVGKRSEPVRKDFAVPDSVDWRTKGVVGPVENEGQCGSCWAFVSSEAVASACAIKHGKYVLLSVQQIIDCSGSFGNDGCNGGLPDQAFQYIIANKGLDTWASYPYTAQDGNCNWNPANVGSCTITAYKDVTPGSETDLVTAIVLEPIATAIDASQTSFQFYSSGVYYDPNCSSTQLDHGVFIIGYGSSNGTDYYLVQNMWGTSWGMDGYIWMSRNRDNNCGIATAASYPIVS
jgi:cathepsin L